MRAPNSAASTPTPPAICPADLSQVVAVNRFELCIHAPVNDTAIANYVVNGLGTSYYVPLKYEIEMWAELSGKSRTWNLTANIKTTLSIDQSKLPVPLVLDQDGTLNCTGAHCVEVNPQPAPGANNLGAYAGDGSAVTITASFQDVTTTATEFFDQFVHIQLSPDPFSQWQSGSSGYIQLGFGDTKKPVPFRCDNQINLPAYIDGGCVANYSIPTWNVSDQAYPAMGLVVKHMAIASCQLAGYGGLAGCPGNPVLKAPLTYDPAMTALNRSIACPASQQPPPAQVALGNTSCDEYPFASTDEGAGNVTGGAWDICWVPPAANSSQGGAFGSGFLAPNRILPTDQFYVRAIYTGNAPGCDNTLQSGGSVTPDNGLDGMFNSYGDNAGCADWSGGDATNSVVLPNGERAWFFSDTYLNSATARKSLWYASTLHNSIVIQNGTALTQTITGGNTCQETDLSKSFWDRYAITSAAPPATIGGWYWTGDQMVVGTNVDKFYYHGYATTTSSGGHSFAIDYPAVASIPVSSLEGNSVVTISPSQFFCGAANIIWGTSLLNWDGNVYVYGWQSNGTNSDSIFLAKTTAADLAAPGKWQLYDGMSGSNPAWGSCGSTPAPLAINGTTGFTVAFENNSLWLVQFDYTNGQANAAGAIGAHPSATPWGFTNTTIPLYDPPTGFVAYPYFYQDYEARIQPGLGPAGQVVISYNVNTTAVDTGCISANAHDTTIYRPRFIDVPLSMFDVANAKAAPGTATAAGRANAPAASSALPGYGIRNSAPPFPAAHPPALATLTRPAASDGPPAAASSGGIDGFTDWYQMQLGGTCRDVPAPLSAPTLFVQQSTGVVVATWENVGTDVWYYPWICDHTANNCAAEGTNTPWVAAWETSQGNLWSTIPEGNLDPVDATTTPGKSTNGHTFAIYVHSFGAGNGKSGGDSPEASVTVTIPPP